MKYVTADIEAIRDRVAANLGSHEQLNEAERDRLALLEMVLRLKAQHAEEIARLRGELNANR